MTACSTEALAVGEPLAGTAPVADAWVIIEQPGSWGSKALRDADLPAGIGPAIATAAAGTGVGVLLARHPSRTVRDRPGRDRPGRDRTGRDRTGRDRTEQDTGHRLWVAGVRPGREVLIQGMVEDLAEVAAWDFSAIAAGTLPALEAAVPALEETATPALLLVCTQGGRDACCARIGRPLIESLLADHAGRRECIWEASHIGGHRFAPTVLALPTGAVHGRLDAAQAGRVLEATIAGEIELSGLRGRSGLPPAAQAAEIAIRERTGERSSASLSVTSLSETSPSVTSPSVTSLRDEADHASVTITHRDGRSWSVELRHVELARPRPESCGAEPLLGKAWQVVHVS